MKLFSRLSSIIVIITLISICTLSFSKIKKITAKKWQGIASYYHPKFNGRKTATGEIFSNKKLTAANNFLKLGTVVKITNPHNGKTVTVTINDRMNAKNTRLIDLSQAAAEVLGLLEQGIGEVILEEV